MSVRIIEEVVRPRVVETDAGTTVVEGGIRTTIVEVAQQGPPGPPGANGEGTDSLTSTHTTAAALSGHRVVKVLDDGTVDYADASVLGDASTVLGVTLGAAIMGASIQIREHGSVTEPSWSWTEGLPVWLGATGHLTQTPPASPDVFSLAIGFALASDTLFVRIEPVVLL